MTENFKGDFQLTQEHGKIALNNHLSGYGLHWPNIKITYFGSVAEVTLPSDADETLLITAKLAWPV